MMCSQQELHYSVLVKEVLTELMANNVLSQEDADKLLKSGEACYKRKCVIAIVSRYNLLAQYQTSSPRNPRLLSALGLTFITDPSLFYFTPGKSPRYTVHDNINWKEQCPSYMQEALLSYISLKVGHFEAHVELIIMTILSTYAIPLKYPQFSSSEGRLKTLGKDPGFILIDPKTHERWFCKKTFNEVNEWFVSNYLISLGLKFPESKLLVDQVGNIYYASYDMSRKYEKEGTEKSKKFKTMEDMLKDSSNDEQKLTTTIKQHFGLKAQAAFAKILISEIIFGLSDLGAHLGNLGLLETSKDAQKPEYKIGLIDFQTSLHLSANITPENLLQTIRDNANKMHPVCAQMAQMLSDEVMIKALHSLLNPKVRENKRGLVLVSAPTQRGTIEDVMQKTFERSCKHLRGLKKEGLSEKDIEEKLDIVTKQYKIIQQNVTLLRQAATAHLGKSQEQAQRSRSTPKTTL